jgi:hypothetical protein
MGRAGVEADDEMEVVVEGLLRGLDAKRIRDATGIESESDAWSVVAGLAESMSRDSSVSKGERTRGRRRAAKDKPRPMPAATPARFRRSPS